MAYGLKLLPTFWSSSPAITSVIKLRRMRWAGCLAWVGEEINAHRIFVVNFKGGWLSDVVGRLILDWILRTYEVIREVKIPHVKADREIFYAYCGNNAIDFDPLLVSHACLTVVEPALSETCLKWQRRSKVPPNVPFRARHHCASGKIQVGYIGPSAVRSGPRAQLFPLVSSPKETSRWEKVRRRWWGARSRDVVQRAGANFYDSWIQKLVPRLNKCLGNAGDYVEK